MSFHKKLDIYVINLNERKDKLDQVIKQFNNEVNLIRVEAIKDIDGKVGCFNSHKKCLKIAKDKNLDQIIVIEDDCFLTKLYKNNFNKKLTEIIDFLKQYKDWDLFLGGTIEIENKNIIKKFINKKLNLFEINKSNTTHFMIYNKTSYDLIINTKLNTPIDNIWNCKLKILVTCPFIAEQSEGYSNKFSNIINKNVLFYRKFRRSARILNDYKNIASNGLITTHLCGGLGNQLFQIFNLISYCLDNNTNFYFDKEHSGYKTRPFYWDNLFIDLKNKINQNIKNKKIYREKSYNFNKIPKNIMNNNFKFVGYYQSYKYFNNNKEKIISLLNLNLISEKIINEYLLNIKINFQNTISMHFRLGDYKNNEKNHPILPLQYYINSLNFIINKSNKDNWNILYFYEKNDEKFVNEKIENLKKIFNNLKFIGIDTNLPDYEQLIIMSNCYHNIIANSTFSWWSGYLNKNNNKIITYPSIWFGKKLNHNTDDLFHSSWFKININ